MNTPILLVASGTSARTTGVYESLEGKCRERFPGHDIHWAFASRRVRELVYERYGQKLPSPEDRIEEMYRAGCLKVVVQSVHLICGEEFHAMAHAVRGGAVEASIGLPLLSGPDDLSCLLDGLSASVPREKDSALVLVGHGTRHPAGLIYGLFDRQLNERFGNRARLRVLSGHPPLTGLGEQLRQEGISKVVLLPLMLVAGVHARKDVAGEDTSSVKRLLENDGFQVEARVQGLLEMPAVLDRLCDHLADAVDRLA
ncbi:MAG: sirohydrochlorin cobaltochelatase [Desulfobacterales bacterium]